MSRPQALVTGGAGFIGRHMCTELENRGYDVVSVDLLPTQVSMMPNGRTRVHIVSDMRDFIATHGNNSFIKYDLVVHCAYHVGGRATIDGLNTNFIRNVQLDAALFDWATRTRQKRVLYFSSSAVYPVSLQTPTPGLERQTIQRLREVDQTPMDDRSAECDAYYGWAKYVGEMQAQVARENGVPVTVVRPFSGYGSDQSTDYPFPSFIQRAVYGEDKFEIWGSAEQTRDWIHVDDVVKGALTVVHDGTTNPINLCTGVTTSMRDLASRCMLAAGNPMEIVVDETKPMGVMHRVGDPTLFFEMYKPEVSIQRGIERAIERERSNIK